MFEKQLLLLIDLERLLGPCPNNLKRIIVLWKRLLFSKWIWKIFKIVKIINPKVWPWNGQGEKNRFSLKQHISGQSSFTSHIWRKHESSGIISFIQKKKKVQMFDYALCHVWYKPNTTNQHKPLIPTGEHSGEGVGFFCNTVSGHLACIPKYSTVKYEAICTTV